MKKARASESWHIGFVKRVKQTPTEKDQPDESLDFLVSALKCITSSDITINDHFHSQMFFLKWPLSAWYGEPRPLYCSDQQCENINAGQATNQIGYTTN